MPCAAGYACQFNTSNMIHNFNGAHQCRGGCGGQLHVFCAHRDRSSKNEIRRAFRRLGLAILPPATRLRVRQGVLEVARRVKKPQRWGCLEERRRWFNRQYAKECAAVTTAKGGKWSTLRQGHPVQKRRRQVPTSREVGDGLCKKRV